MAKRRQMQRNSRLKAARAVAEMSKEQAEELAAELDFENELHIGLQKQADDDFFNLQAEYESLRVRHETLCAHHVALAEAARWLADAVYEQNAQDAALARQEVMALVRQEGAYDD